MSFLEDYEPFFQAIKQAEGARYPKGYVEMHLSTGEFYIYDNEKVSKAKIIFDGAMPRFAKKEYGASLQLPLSMHSTADINGPWR